MDMEAGPETSSGAPSCGWRSCPQWCTGGHLARWNRGTCGTRGPVAAVALPITWAVWRPKRRRGTSVAHHVGPPPGPGAGATAAWCGPAESGTSRHAQDQRPVRWIKVEAHNARTFSMRRGLGFRCGKGAPDAARVWLRPERWAMDRVLQCVASLGVDSRA